MGESGKLCHCPEGSKPILDKETCVDAAKVLLTEYHTPCQGTWDASIGDGEQATQDPVGCFNSQSMQQPCGGLVLNREYTKPAPKTCSNGMFCQQLCTKESMNFV